MKVNIYSLFDIKISAYGTPFFAPSDPVAVRSVRPVVNDPSSTLCHSPEDFSLRRIGSFDDASGYIESLEAPVFVCECSALKMEAKSE